jgi:hypothetical protein
MAASCAKQTHNRYSHFAPLGFSEDHQHQSQKAFECGCANMDHGRLSANYSNRFLGYGYVRALPASFAVCLRNRRDQVGLTHRATACASAHAARHAAVRGRRRNIHLGRGITSALKRFQLASGLPVRSIALEAAERVLGNRLDASGLDHPVQWRPRRDEVRPTATALGGIDFGRLRP